MLSAACSSLVVGVSMCLKIKHPAEQIRNSKRADTISFLRCTSAAPLLSADTRKFLQIYFTGIFSPAHLAKEAPQLRNFFRRRKWMKSPDWKLTTSHWASPSWQAASYPTPWRCLLWKGEGESCLLLAVIQHDFFKNHTHHLAVTLYEIIKKNHQDEQELHRTSEFPEFIPTVTFRKDTTGVSWIALSKLQSHM